MNKIITSFYVHPYIVLALGMVIGAITALHPALSVGLVLLVVGAALISYAKQLWKYGIWVSLFGLAIWSYGFNNIPLVHPLPLVDALVGFAVIFSQRYWFSLRRFRIVRNLLILLLALVSVVCFRLVLDMPRFGLLAPRDALFAFELWVIFPAIVLGITLGERSLEKILLWLFSLTTIWSLLYPWKELVTSISPVVGIQRPVPLFAFTTAGFIAVPAFFWFMYRRGIQGFLGSAASLLVLLFAQARGPYIAFALSVFSLLYMRPRKVLKRWWKIGVAGIVVVALLWVVGNSLRGRLGAPVGIETALEQLGTLLGREGPGSGSFHHRLVTWPMVSQQVMDEPMGPIFGVGLGADLFRGFTVRGGILVRKPHNDFLEIWARLGILGLLPWLGFVITLLRESWRGVRLNPKYAWVLALQITLLITSASEPAMGFAYITIVWTILTGLWLGTRLREQSGFNNS